MTDILDRLRTIQELAKTINTLRAERDQARRELCIDVWINGGVTPHEYAEARKWDCFEEKP